MLFSDVWGENAALFKRLIKVHSKPPNLYSVALISGVLLLNQITVNMLKE